MKSLNPKQTRAGGAAACPPGRGAARRPKTRRLATLSVAIVALALLAIVSSTSASRLAARASLGGSSSTDRPHLINTEAAGARRDGASRDGRGTPGKGLDYSLMAAPLLQETEPTPTPTPAAEAVETFAADCLTPKTTFALGETVCARGNNIVVGGSIFFPVIPLRKFSWINPAGYVIRSTVISAITQTDSFTLPTDATATFGEHTEDNRGGWRVDISSIFESYQRATTGFTVRDPQNAAVDLSVIVTPEQRTESLASGAQAPFIVAVENKGPDAASTVELTLPVPNHSTFYGLTQSDGPTFTCQDPAVGTGPSGSSVCTIESLQAGERATFLAIYLVGSTDPTTEITSEPTVASATTERDEPNNASTASYRVSGQAACTINTPADITVDNDIVNGQPAGGAAVTYGAATGTGNCGTITCTPPSGSFFPVGENFVTCTNQAQDVVERFKITVNDTRTPAITCPADFTVQESSPGSGSAVVNFPAPTVSDNDPNVQVTFDPPSGLPLELGEHTITATATDASGNSASCTFKVTVVARQGECTITPDVANLPTITGECSAVATVIPTATDSCTGRIGATTDDPRSYDEPGTYTITWKYTNAAGTTVTQTQNVVVTAGSGTLTITGAPTVTVPITAGAPDCSVQIADLGAVLNTNIGGSCSGVDVTRTVTPAVNDNVYPAGFYTVVTTVTNGTSTASLTQTLRVVDGINPTVNAPADATYECPAQVPAANPSQATAADNCGTPTVTVNETNNGGVGSAASPLVITRTFTATDSGGRTASDAQIITVIDDTPPVITAPPDKTVNADPVTCSVAVDIGSPIYSDNCNAHITNDAPGLFPLGETTVTWTATDDAGNSTVVTQKVRVVDVTKPVITLVGAGTITHECHTPFTDPGTTVFDACDSAVQVNAAGAVDVNTPGTYTITYTATDASGNAATPVTRTVNVVDTTPPTIACPPNITVYLPPNTPDVSMPVSFAVTAGDSCDSTPSVAFSHAPGSIFPVGTTTVTATATDDSGNSTSCSFNVTVLYNFTGFFSPVENPPTLNLVNAGRAIPVKFSLSGNKGLGIFADGYPVSQQIACDTSAPVSEVEETVSAGSSSLSYDATSDRYNYVWKTNSAWASTCRQLTVKLNDGTSHTALFKFK